MDINTTNKHTTKYWFIAIIIGIVLFTSTFSVGFIAGRLIPNGNDSSFLIFPGLDNFNLNESGSGGTSDNLEDLFSPFWQSWKLVHDQYVTQPVNDELLMRGAVEGMINALGDEHSSYISPEELEIFNAQITGEEYEGIGAWVDVTKDYLTIVSPMIGSPAEKGGLKPGDQVIAINGEDMTGMDGELVRQKILGPAGSQLELTIQRPGVAEPFHVTLVRAAITSSNVISQMLDNNIAYIHLLTFGDKKTTDDLRTALKLLLHENPKGLIFDLRNNGGGLLDSAVDVASEFLPSGIVAYEEYGDGRLEVFKVKSGGLATEIPVVILVNEGSASASEIVAGAIQDQKRGVLVGVTTYGKGSVQLWNELVNDEGAVRITIAKWLTPNKRTIHGTGLTPDYIVENDPEAFQNGIDLQLNKAIELLLSE
jgi:carboxyl-terminal processing protease